MASIFLDPDREASNYTFPLRIHTRLGRKIKFLPVLPALIFPPGKLYTRVRERKFLALFISMQAPLNVAFKYLYPWNL